MAGERPRGIPETDSAGHDGRTTRTSRSGRRGSDDGSTYAIRHCRELINQVWPDVLPTGLHKFDLGWVPASVTPPRSGRRAAWFVVGTATCVVVALGSAAVTLVGRPPMDTTIDALPGPPVPVLTIASVPPQPSVPATTPGARQPASTPTTRPVLPQPRQSPEEPGQPVIVTSDPPARATRSVTAPRPTAPAGSGTPPRTTAHADPPAADPAILGERTRQYFLQVLANPLAAHQLTAGAMWDEGPEGIQARYAGIERIEVQGVTVDPTTRSSTRSDLVVVYKSGSTRVVRRELAFSSGVDPKIIKDRRVAEREPAARKLSALAGKQENPPREAVRAGNPTVPAMRAAASRPAAPKAVVVLSIGIR